jgi:flagellar protein FlbD
MIPATRLDGSCLSLNMDLIVSIETTPDTLVSLATGDTVPVREDPAESVNRIARFKGAVAWSAADRDPGEVIR